MFFNILDLEKSLFSKFNFPSLVILSVEWDFGFLLVFFCFIQIISGVILVFFFKVGLESCLMSKSFISKELECGWFFIFTHMMCSNYVFFLVYFHLFSSVWNLLNLYLSVWFSGFVLYFFMVIIGFSGYALVFGSLGFWAVVVVSGMVQHVVGVVVSYMAFSDFKFISDFLALKVYIYHVFFSLFLVMLITFHIYLVHSMGSFYSVFEEGLGYIFYGWYFFHKTYEFWKVLFSFMCFYLDFSFLETVFGLEEFDSTLEEDVPSSINSEWYLSSFFMILSGVESKFLGMKLVEFCFLTILFKVFTKSCLGFWWLGSWSSVFLVILMGGLLMFSCSEYGGSFFLTSFFLFLFLGIYDFLLLEVFSFRVELDFVSFSSGE